MHIFLTQQQNYSVVHEVELVEHTRRKWPNRFVANTSWRPSELSRSCWVRRPSAVANMLMTFLRRGQKQAQVLWRLSRLLPASTRRRHDSFLNLYLEKRPLKNAPTSTVGLGMIPAFRYKKSMRLYLWRHASERQSSHLWDDETAARWLFYLPGLDLLCRAQNWLHRAHVQLQ